MGLLLSSPGVHVSWTPLSSWLVSSKSKGGFGTSVEQTHTHIHKWLTVILKGSFILYLWCYAQRDTLETHHSCWSVSMRWKWKRHNWGCWEHCTPKPTHQGVLFTCFSRHTKSLLAKSTEAEQGSSARSVCVLLWAERSISRTQGKQNSRGWETNAGEWHALFRGLSVSQGSVETQSGGSWGWFLRVGSSPNAQARFLSGNCWNQGYREAGLPARMMLLRVNSLLEAFFLILLLEVCLTSRRPEDI